MENAPSKNNLENIQSGDFFKGTVKILRKARPGPVIFNVTDGFNIIEAVTKDSNFDVDDVVDLAGKVEERMGKIQIEIAGMVKSENDFTEIISKHAEPKEKPTSIKSKRFDIMRPYFLKIAKRIRRAVLENQPIFIRHHADADGIISGLSIEKACELLMKDIGVEPNYNLYRFPSRAPFYETTDMIKDFVFTKRFIESHGQKKPLILVVDNGSTPEDVFAMKSMHLLGFEIIVIDHHNPVVLKNKKTAVCPYVQLHLNPYIEGLDGKTSAGMLCYEIGRLIHPKFDEPLFPAVAGITDRCEIQETDDYIKLTKKSKEELGKIGAAVDFLAYQLRFDAGAGAYEEVFKNTKFVELLNEKINEGVETQLQSTLPYVRSQNIKGVLFSTIDVEKYTVRFTYPNPGKVVGLVHDEVAKGHENTPVITMGILPDMIIIRATQPVLPVQTIIDKLKKDMPEANVDGGGHECAGTIKFVSAHQVAVLENIKEQLKDLNYVEKGE